MEAGGLRPTFRRAHDHAPHRPYRSRQDRARYSSQGSILFDDSKEGRQTMIAVRTTWMVKPNCMEKALEMLTSSPHELGDHVVRIYTPKFSPDLLVFEVNYYRLSAGSLECD